MLIKTLFKKARIYENNKFLKGETKLNQQSIEFL